MVIWKNGSSTDSSVFVPFTIKALDVHTVKELIRADLNSPFYCQITQNTFSIFVFILLSWSTFCLHCFTREGLNPLLPHRFSPLTCLSLLSPSNKVEITNKQPDKTLKSKLLKADRDRQNHNKWNPLREQQNTHYISKSARFFFFFLSVYSAVHARVV